MSTQKPVGEHKIIIHNRQYMEKASFCKLTLG